MSVCVAKGNALMTWKACYVSMAAFDIFFLSLCACVLFYTFSLSFFLLLCISSLALIQNNNKNPWWRMEPDKKKKKDTRCSNKKWALEPNLFIMWPFKLMICVLCTHIQLSFIYHYATEPYCRIQYNDDCDNIILGDDVGFIFPHSHTALPICVCVTRRCFVCSLSQYGPMYKLSTNFSLVWCYYYLRRMITLA